MLILQDELERQRAETSVKIENLAAGNAELAKQKHNLEYTTQRCEQLEQQLAAEQQRNVALQTDLKVFVQKDALDFKICFFFFRIKLKS